MSIPKLYTTPGLELGYGDRNPYLIATKYYTDCVRNYFSLFQKKEDLQKELARDDINTVCKKELEDLRSIIGDIRYKEVLGSQSPLLRNDLYEEHSAGTRRKFNM